ncbi:carbon storage regulator CsrA [Campylobacter lari]|uniref:Translational regulator CsrA n=5 Tax=Campylobacter TaxID=194 RepID=B9KCU1_CAMLR|nr:MULTISPECIES: carbon storage regulator CsrA [Campylobacter]MCR8677151.1 carbon storage regulator CsrA [Campylobacter sp. S4:11]MCR8682448.1 carbon storage regulator CsrA [Campylobacter sp. LMG 17559]MCR8686692.1 carbon storage regulator CsrA [Campylobacter sp. 1569]MCR8698437.1 carbon storage regulator CsrA [Campylobacter sp. LMG 7929]MCR8704635.1 carbon storage regulator CsrA [Campylobacter sp. 2352 PW]MCR8706508.1 carbon storage regulator CsrA [Campylobacter sp. W0066.2]MCR8707963.1 car
MLILSRKENESIKIGDDIEIKVVQTGKGYAKIGIEAPKSLMILRKELIEQVKSENLHAISDETIKLDDLSKKLKK